MLEIQFEMMVPSFTEQRAFYSMLYIQTAFSVDLSYRYEHSAYLEIKPQVSALEFVTLSSE